MKKFFCIIMVIGILCMAAACGGPAAEEGTTQPPEEEKTQSATAEETVEPLDFNWKKDMTVSLFIGIDNSNNEEEAGSDMEVDSNQTTMADALFLLVTDEKEGTSRIIGINRDTITDVDVYDENGEYFRTMDLQIALSHGYGADETAQCENTVKAVSNLFGGLTIDHYVALKMAAIPEINDAFDGVEVDVLEDMTEVDSDLKEGKTITLRGDQALTYVKWRNTDVLDSSNLRVERQKQYLAALSEKLVSDDVTAKDILMIKEMISQYMVTNCTNENIMEIFRQFRTSQLDNASFQMVPGKIQEGDIYAEFIVNQQALNELELELLCE
ncbi:MAG: LCP family protein [Lachnospiraceae bacterium]|nr:LCP family protein [Lachnospiraceae bacterium]